MKNQHTYPLTVPQGAKAIRQVMERACLIGGTSYTSPKPIALLRNTRLASLLLLLAAAGFLLPAFGAPPSVVFTSLYSFGVVTNGNQPFAGLVLGSDGYFYGTTSAGGTNGGYGTVFRISTNGTLTTLHSFGRTDGDQPRALVQGSDGFLYGTTSFGGTNNSGTVFKISTDGTLTSLYSFTGGSDGANPSAGLAQGSDGNFYGTTRSGGAYTNYGTVFQISSNGLFTSLYSFSGSDGSFPVAGLVQGTDGNLYGTTWLGGAYVSTYSYSGYGTVFQISTNGAFISLYSFTGGTDGSGPAALMQGTDGNFYGTTFRGGSAGNGTVFQIDATGTLNTLYLFNGTDGSNPAALVQGTDGNLYGTTASGGSHTNQIGQGYGTIFQITTSGAFTSLCSFTGLHGVVSSPRSVVQGNDGYFYGTTGFGGSTPAGSVFRMSATGALTTLYSFTLSADGANPTGLVQGRDGKLYGCAASGGNYLDSSGNWSYVGYGTVFQITTNGTLTRLHAFNGSFPGSGPQSSLVQGSDGYLYGATDSFFRISTAGVFTGMYKFNPYGAVLSAWLIQGRDGYFYGATGNNGGASIGSIFRIAPFGTPANLHSFANADPNLNPNTLLQASDGYLYSTTDYGGAYTNQWGDGYGNVFRVSTSGVFTNLYSFTGGSDGANPRAVLVQGADGYLYGTTEYGGTYTNNGTVFKISTNGALTNVYSFRGGSDGANPRTALVQGADGYLYGTTLGGANNSGTVFQISTNGALTTLYSFTGGNDGGIPFGLVLGTDGAFYGTTGYGGQGGVGTVFRLAMVSATQPALTLIPSGPNVILTWPTNATGFTLQSTTNLGPSAVWTTNSPAPVIVNDQNVITNPISGTQQFFRLSQ